MLLYELEEVKGVVIVVGVDLVGVTYDFAHDLRIALSIYCRDIQQLRDIEQPLFVDQSFAFGCRG